MGQRTASITKQHLIDAPLPQHADTYTVISHEFVINKALSELGAKGFVIKDELYRCNRGAQIAQGKYLLSYGNDPEMGMMFAWSNSYDKSMRFKCAIGGYVHQNHCAVISGDMGSWGRKHTGTADADTEETIQAQIDGADIYYNQLVHDKEQMKGVLLDIGEKSSVLGRLFLEHRLLNVEQLSMVRQEIQHPSYNYTSHKDSLWVLYNHITHALKSAHPRDWIDHQRMVHWFLTDEFGIRNPLVNMSSPQPTAEDERKPGHQVTLEEGIQDAEKASTSA